MTLYHGSNMPISEINLTKCRPYKDFGKGFYLTSLEEQAVIMAKRVSKLFGGVPYVTLYDFNENCLKDQYSFHTPKAVNCLKKLGDKSYG